MPLWLKYEVFLAKNGQILLSAVLICSLHTDL